MYKFAVGVVACFLTFPASAQALRCDITTKFVCVPSGCKTVPPDVWSVIDEAKREYSRCDKKGCDTHDAVIGHSGAFMTVQVGPNTIAKMATINSELAELKAFSFHEVATQMHAVYVSYGTCRQN
jgi:hypothetical protein